MANIFTIIASLIACLTYTVSAAESIPPRVFPSCGYVSSQIYCYGGGRDFSFGQPSDIDEDIYSLNINKFVGQKSDSMSSQWNKIVPAAPFQIEQRKLTKLIELSDGKRLLILGGETMNLRRLQNQTIIYDTVSNLWSVGTPFINETELEEQIYSTTAVNLPNDSIGFYGGYNQLPIPLSSAGLYRYNSSFAFYRLTTLTVSSGVWSSFSPQSSQLAYFFPNSQTATFNPYTGKIYYLGGRPFSSDPETPNEIPTMIPFRWAAVFNTISGDWLNQTLHGDAPTDRLHHTASLLPNSQDIVIYGGSNDNVKPSDDYCYTLNLETNTWTANVKVNVPLQLSGPRFAHSAILVNSTLFILFGIDFTGNLSPSLITIDVSDVSNIAYTDTYASNTNLTATMDSTKPEGLSKGAIGGITAGSVVAGSGIIVIICLYLRRQKKVKRQGYHENMTVDWDKIEKQHNEDPAADLNFRQFTEPTEIIGIANKRHYSPNLVENNNDLSFPTNKSPNTVINAIKPSVILVDDYVSVKPDVQ